MYIPLTKQEPNNVYSLQIKSTKNIYIALAGYAKIMYIEHICIV